MSLDPITGLIEAGKMAIQRIWPDPMRQAEEERKLLELAQSGDLKRLELHVRQIEGQLKINEKEAEHKSVFVAGWRPFVGWVCGLALLYASIIDPFARFVAKVIFGYEGEFPVVNTDITMQVLLGILGLGAYRSYEKQKGVNSNSIKNKN